MGYGNTTKSPLYFCLKNRTLLRCHHLIVNDATHHAEMPNMFTTSTDETPTLNLKHIELDLLKTPFSNSEIFTYEIDLPLHATDIGMEIYDDEYFNIPVLKKCIPDTPAYLEIPASNRRNMFIVSINNEEPITSGFALELLSPRRLRSQDGIKIKVQLVKRISSARSKLQELRSTFDQVRPIIAATSTTPTTTPSPTPTQPFHHIAPHTSLDAAQLQLPDKPKCERFLHLNLRGPYRQQFYASLFNEYSKNNEIPALSAPILKASLSKDTRFFPSRIANAIKSDPDNPSIYTFRSRHTIDGSGMRQGLDYKYSYSPTASIDTIRIQIAVSASNGNILFVLDIKNAFQTTILEDLEQVFITCPPYYLEWHFRQQTSCHCKWECRE
jgi:hypothetical protein